MAGDAPPHAAPDPSGDPETDANSTSRSQPGTPNASKSDGNERTDRPENADASEPGDEAESLRQHLLASVRSLYALAQAFTGSEHEARRLVETTYARAAEALAAGRGPSPGEVRPWLFTVLVETVREQPDAEPLPSEDPADDARGGRHFRRRAQKRFLRRALPPAFATLTPGQRLLLTLRDIEQLELPEAAQVANAGEEDARRQMARARADLRDALRQMAPRPERAFLEEEALSDARLRQALRQMAKRDLTAPPPALRPTARNILRGKRSAPDERPSAPGAPLDTAPDRPASPPEQDAPLSSWRQRLPRLLVALLLIAVAGGVGYLTTAVLDRPAETDLAALSAQQASDVDVRLRTERAERAEQYVRDELDRHLTVPHIQGAVLRGVGVAEVVPGERVPVFLFSDSGSGRPVTTYAYDYALLDRADGRLHLPSGLRQQLEEEGRFATKDVDDRRVLLWRHRDDIFAAVTDRADSLQQRIAF